MVLSTTYRIWLGRWRRRLVVSLRMENGETCIVLLAAALTRRSLSIVCRKFWTRYIVWSFHMRAE